MTIYFYIVNNMTIICINIRRYFRSSKMKSRNIYIEKTSGYINLSEFTYFKSARMRYCGANNMQFTIPLPAFSERVIFLYYCINEIENNLKLMRVKNRKALNVHNRHYIPFFVYKNNYYIHPIIILAILYTSDTVDKSILKCKTKYCKCANVTNTFCNSIRKVENIYKFNKNTLSMLTDDECAEYEFNDYSLSDSALSDSYTDSVLSESTESMSTESESIESMSTESDLSESSIESESDEDTYMQDKVYVQNGVQRAL